MISKSIFERIITRGTMVLRTVKPLLKKKFIIPALSIILVLWLKPQLNVQFKSYSGPGGYGHVYEATIDVKGGRPYGISNLLVEMSFPSDLVELKIISNGGCENLQVLKDTAIEPNGLDWKRTVSRTARIVAKECPDGAKPIFQFSTAGVTLEDPVVDDEGSYKGKFDWLLPFKVIAIPWSTIFFWTAPEGVIQSTQQETPYIATYGYPASVSPPPYYDLVNHSGRIVSILNPRDYNDRLKMERATVTFFNRPSTRIVFRFEDKGYVWAEVRWFHCNKPITVKKRVQQVDLSNYINTDMNVCLELKWKDCEAYIDVYDQCSAR
jgi:hypothetical protein